MTLQTLFDELGEILETVYTERRDLTKEELDYLNFFIIRETQDERNFE